MSKYNIRYCIACGEEVAVEDGEEGHTILEWYRDGMPDVSFCDGPFTSCPPPDNFDEDWDMNLEEPSPEELAEMSLQAEQLLQELEG